MGGFKLRLEDEARINVTMLRLVNGIPIYEVMKLWTYEEKATAVIMWRLAQHQKASELELFADMMIEKARNADPYRRDNDTW